MSLFRSVQPAHSGDRVGDVPPPPTTLPHTPLCNTYMSRLFEGARPEHIMRLGLCIYFEVLTMWFHPMMMCLSGTCLTCYCIVQSFFFVFGDNVQSEGYKPTVLKR